MAFPDNDSSNCTILRDYFAESASNFTSCAINSSRPIKLCENCVNSYLNVVNSYKNMSQVVYCLFYLEQITNHLLLER